MRISNITLMTCFTLMTGLLSAPLMGQVPIGQSTDSLEAVLRGVLSSGQPKSMLYLEPYEVRHEILMPFSLMDDWANVPQEDETILTTTERQRSARNIVRFMVRKNPIVIDGESPDPSGFSLVYFDVENMEGDSTDSMEVKNTIVGCIIRYDAAAVTESLSMTWDLFGTKEEPVDNFLYPFDDEPQNQVFLPTDNTLTWKNEKNRVLASVEEIAVEKSGGGWFGGVSKIDDEKAETISSSLIHNIYKAFELKREEAIYESLALSVSGQLLTNLYLQVQEGLNFAAEGGATSRVRDVQFSRFDLKESGKTPEGSQFFRMDADWEVIGTVEHWGHIHTRTNAYSAEVDIAAEDGAWKISRFQVKKQKRLEESYVRREDLENKSKNTENTL